MLPPKQMAEHLFATTDTGSPHDDKRTKGEIGYELYREKQGGKAYNGQPIPPWREVRPDIREAWEYIGATLYAWGYNDGYDDGEDDDEGNMP